MKCNLLNYKTISMEIFGDFFAEYACLGGYTISEERELIKSRRELEDIEGTIMRIA